MNSKTFGEYLRNARMAKKISLRKFANLVDLSPTYISMIEQGKQKSPPTEDNIRLMASILDLDVDEMLGKARRVSEDLQDIITERPQLMASFLRTAHGKSDEQLRKLMKKLDKE